MQLLSSFGMAQPVAYDPFCPPSIAEAAGVRLVSLDELLRTADFVSVHCPLNDKTRGLIGKDELAKMKPDAYLLNTARGGIVDETALLEILKADRIAGVALDCFEKEPVLEKNPPLTQFPQVITAPHCIGWTKEYGCCQLGCVPMRVSVSMRARQMCMRVLRWSTHPARHRPCVAK